MFTLLVGIMAFYLISQSAFNLAMIYLIILFLWPFILIFSICRKCLCQKHCTHVYLGKITLKMFSNTKTAYSKVDLILANGWTLLVAIYPFPWLLSDLFMLIVFYAAIIIAGPFLMPILCPKCENINCPLNQQFSRNS